MIDVNTSSKIDISDRQFEIITAAGKILTRSGVHGLTIKSIATEMQFSESAVYRHYSSKEDIIISLLEYLEYDMNARFNDALAGESDTQSGFIKLLTNQAAFFSVNPYFVVVVFSDGLLEESERINAAIMKIMQTKTKHLLPIISSGQQNGCFRTDLTAEDLAHIVMGSFRLLMYKWRVANFKFNLKRKNDQLIQSILTLIKTPN